MAIFSWVIQKHGRQSYAPALAALGILCMLVQPLLALQEERISMRWNELSEVVTGRKIMMVTKDGTDVTGKVISVDQESLQIRISEASATYRKGVTTIPRFQISVVRVKTTSGPWRTLGTAIGAGAGTGGGIAAYSLFNNEGNAQAGAGIAATLIGGEATVGYLLGRDADGKVLIISIVDRLKGSPGSCGRLPIYGSIKSGLGCRYVLCIETNDSKA